MVFICEKDEICSFSGVPGKLEYLMGWYGQAYWSIARFWPSFEMKWLFTFDSCYSQPTFSLPFDMAKFIINEKKDLLKFYHYSYYSICSSLFLKNESSIICLKDKRNKFWFPIKQEFCLLCDQSIGSTETKYIKLNTKTKFVFNNIRLWYTL